MERWAEFGRCGTHCQSLLHLLSYQEAWRAKLYLLVGQPVFQENCSQHEVQRGHLSERDRLRALTSCVRTGPSKLSSFPCMSGSGSKSKAIVSGNQQQARVNKGKAVKRQMTRIGRHDSTLHCIASHSSVTSHERGKEVVKEFRLATREMLSDQLESQIFKQIQFEYRLSSFV